MTDINDIKRELEALTAKVAAYEAAKARSWPERIEAGMVFRVNGESMMVPNGKPVSYVIALTGEKVGMSHYGWESAPGIEYLGHARDILTIRTDAHEPTGAELVGRVCEFSDRLTGPWSPGECAAFGQNSSYPYRKAGGAEWRYARLAK